jgi:uncharacterized protein with beta-barrel porin domain
MQTAMYAGEDAASDVLSCHLRDGAGAETTEDGCVWLKLNLRRLDRKSTSNDFGFKDDDNGLSGGFQRHLGGPWYASASLGYDSHFISFRDVPAQFSGEMGVGAAALKWQQGPGVIAVSVAGGGGEFSSQREIDLAGPYLSPNLAQARFNVSFVEADLQAAWESSNGPAYIKPRIDINVNYESLGAFAETGAGAIGSRSNGSSHTGIAAKPAVEIGYDIHSSGPMIRPWVILGAAWRPDAKFDISSSFIGSLPAAGTYVQSTRIDKLTGTVAAGFDIVENKLYNLSFSYQGDYGTRYIRQGARMKLNIAF